MTVLFFNHSFCTINPQAHRPLHLHWGRLPDCRRGCHYCCRHHPGEEEAQQGTRQLRRAKGQAQGYWRGKGIIESAYSTVLGTTLCYKFQAQPTFAVPQGVAKATLKADHALSKGIASAPITGVDKTVPRSVAPEPAGASPPRLPIAEETAVGWVDWDLIQSVAQGALPVQSLIDLGPFTFPSGTGPTAIGARSGGDTIGQPQASGVMQFNLPCLNPVEDRVFFRATGKGRRCYSLRSCNFTPPEKTCGITTLEDIHPAALRRMGTSSPPPASGGMSLSALLMAGIASGGGHHLQAPPPPLEPSATEYQQSTDHHVFSYRQALKFTSQWPRSPGETIGSRGISSNGDYESHIGRQMSLWLQISGLHPSSEKSLPPQLKERSSTCSFHAPCWPILCRCHRGWRYNSYPASSDELNPSSRQRSSAQRSWIQTGESLLC